jgi:prevent-host-death family protein
MINYLFFALVAVRMDCTMPPRKGTRIGMEGQGHSPRTQFNWLGLCSVPARRFHPLHGRAILVAPKKVPKKEPPVLDITNDIQSLTTFRRRSGDFMKQLKKTKRPVVLTVKGKAAAIVQDAEAYQRLLDIAARADANEGIRQGLEDAKQGKVRPAREFFEDFEAGHGIPR